MLLDLSPMLAMPVVLFRCSQQDKYAMCYGVSFLLVSDELWRQQWVCTRPRQEVSESLEQVLYVTTAHNSIESDINT